ncbi:hypothetical protein [Tenacibaculum sp. 190524A02b]|uniref:hypothetical protein n=1 Tax=Tenacibaculum vairaonense TaxID=3137860 RepID=UPI0031FB330A
MNTYINKLTEEKYEVGNGLAIIDNYDIKFSDRVTQKEIQDFKDYFEKENNCIVKHL